MGKRILIVIPAYNEEERIGLLLDKLSGLFNLSDVLVVDDGSEDETASIANDYGVFLVKQPTNLGKGMALKKGFEFAIEKGYEAVITMDSDLQHNPEEIPKFIRLFEEEGGDILIGTREHDLHNMPFMRFLVNNVTSLVASILA
ncbi:glycosyltransferase family 2 protein, partial [candidate division WOR-3 bacterium]|nr:glycosyltransferase family 2 protein [candidate division WOR-3 bacterium]